VMGFPRNHGLFSGISSVNVECLGEEMKGRQCPPHDVVWT
jgi:hypothetical protein